MHSVSSRHAFPTPGAGGGIPAGRYLLCDEIAAGGMATVHLGRLCGPVGFARIVAIKRLHAHFAKDPDFSLMFLDEARLAARIRHPNVVSTLDVVSEGENLLLVMEYVPGESLSRLVRAARRKGVLVPPRVASAIMAGVLHGLHAAHEAKSDHGESLHIVHRDVSPQNVLVAADGIARVLDFGVAKAAGRYASTRAGALKGKLAYMAPEQVRSQNVDRRVDIYAAGVVLWEALTSQRMFEAEQEVQLFNKVLSGCSVPPSAHAPGLDPRLDAIVMRALAMDPEARFATAREMARALEDIGIAAATEVGDWVESLAGELLSQRAEKVAEIESRSSHGTEGGGGAVDVATRANVPMTDLAAPVAEPSSLGSYGPAPSTGVSALMAKPPRRRIVIASAAAVGVATIAVALFLLLSRPRNAPVSSAVAASPPVPTQGASPPAVEPVPTVELSTLPVVRVDPPASATPSSRPRPAYVAPPPVRKPASAPAGSCDPPYYFDDTGTKHYKRGCM